MAVPTKTLKLVERFDRNLRAYKQGPYNEAQARIEFIDPLFKALGWDMDNEQGYAEAYKYDDMPHHPTLESHPHHKHAGREANVLPAEPPLLRTVLP